MRVFVAIQFDLKTKNKIFDIQKKLNEKTQKARFTPKDNLHLTLVFIGQTDPERINDIIQAIKKANFQPIDIIFEGTGSFGKGRKNVFWLGIKNNTQLNRIYKELFYALTQMGFELQKRKFTPHITLARDVLKEDNKKIIFERFSYKARTISLMQTVMGEGKTYYKELYRLGDTQALDG